MLRKPLLLLIDPLGLEVWQISAGTLRRRAGFGPDAHDAFASWLNTEAGRRSCRVLVNLPDEGFEHEDLPRASARDRRALVTRRCGAWFPHTPFVHAWPAGPATSGRKGAERFVFAGLERPAPLQAWLDALQRGRGRLTHLIPAASLIPALGTPRASTADAPATLLLAGLTRAGLRLSLVNTRTLLFSRLITHCTATSGAAWEDELERTRTYLLAQHLLPPETPVSAHLLGAIEPDTAASPSGALEPDAPLTPVDQRLLGALARARPAQGWPPHASGPHPRTHAARAFAPATLSLGALVVAAGIGGTWLAPGQTPTPAATEEPQPLSEPAPLPAAPAPPPVADEADATPQVAPPSVTPATAPASTPTAPAAAHATRAPEPRPIQGIVHRHGGTTRVWIGNALHDAHTLGLRTHGGTALSPRAQPHVRLRVGDAWPLPRSAQGAPRPADQPVSDDAQ